MRVIQGPAPPWHEGMEGKEKISGRCANKESATEHVPTCRQTAAIWPPRMPPLNLVSLRISVPLRGTRSCYLKNRSMKG